MLALLYIVGLAAVVVGVALVSVPAALVVGGTLSSVTALTLARGSVLAEPVAEGD